MRPVVAAESTAVAVAAGPIDVHARPRLSCRTRLTRRSLNAPRQTRSQASSLWSSAHTGSVALSVFGSMITRASGQLVRTSSSRGTFTPRPRNAGRE